MTKLTTTCLCLLLSSVSLGQERTRKTFEEVAGRIVKAIDAADYKGMRKEFDPQMLRVFTEAKCKQFFQGISGQLGKIEKLEAPQFESESVAKFVTRFERGTLAMTLTLDKQGRVAGIFFKPHTEQPVREKNQTKLTLPFKEEWFVFWGGDTVELNYHHNNPAQRFAFDLVAVGADGRTHTADGTRNEDYYAFGREILAPADGVVTEVIDGVRDNVPGSMNPLSALGNAVFLQHREHEVSVFAHFIQGSTKVKLGDKVKRGQLLGLCGNSGNSSEPHLHYHLQNSPIIQDATGIKCFFENVSVEQKGSKLKKPSYSPIKGDLVSPLMKD